MKMRLLVAMIVFGISMFCGLVIVTNGVLAGRFNSMYGYTAGMVCHADEKLVLLVETSTTPGTVVIDNTAYSDVGYSANTLFCVNETTRDKRDVTNEVYDAYEKLKVQIGWWATIVFFVVTMILILVFEPAIIKRVDRIIGYKPPENK